MRIGLIVAMTKEFKQLESLLENTTTERHSNKDFIIGNIGDKEIVLQQCGIGKVNSAIGAVEMINNYRPDLVISTGCAGGAGKDMKVMDVVVGTNYVYHDAYCGSECAFGQIIGMPAAYPAPAEIVAKATNIDSQTAIHAGQIVSGEWFVNSQDKMRSIINNFPDAKAVDMESCSIAQTCHVYGVPFISFRVISDMPLEDNEASQYYDFWDRLAQGSFDVTRKFINNL